MADISNANCAMRVVPITREEFKMVQNESFVTFLATFGIEREESKEGKTRKFMHVSNKVKPEEFKKVVD